MFLPLARSFLARVAPRLPMLMVCAAGGLVINFAIAWTAVVFHEPSGAPERLSRAGGLVWPSTVGLPAQGERLHLRVSSGRVVDWFDAYLVDHSSRAASRARLPDIWAESVRIEDLDGAGVRAGWPFRSVYACAPDASILPGSPRTALQEANLILGAWRIPWGAETRLLPRSILLPGATANILLFTLTLYLLAAGPRAFRSMLWRQNLRCPICGYPVQQLVVCPECGAAID